MFETDASLIAYSLNMWANYIETGDICLNAQDARNTKKEINALTTSQMEMVIRLRKLSSKSLTKPSVDVTDEEVMKMATILRDLFDFRFSGRQWGHLPPETQQEWIDAAKEVIDRMCAL